MSSAVVNSKRIRSLVVAAVTRQLSGPIRYSAVVAE